MAFLRSLSMFAIKFKKYNLITILLLIPFLGIFAGKDHSDYENIFFRQLDVFDGLPNNTINAIGQDAQGFMWFGTRNGLCRYDGYTIKTYLSTESTNGIPDNFINGIYSCKESKDLWISTTKGLVRYLSQEDHFKRYLSPKTESNINSKKVLYTSKGKLLVATNNGILTYNARRDTFTTYFPKRINALDLVEDHRQNLWIATPTGLVCYNSSSRTFIEQALPISFYTDILRKSGCTKLFVDPYNRIWVRTMHEGLFVIDIDNGEINQIENVNNQIVRSFISDEFGNVWVGAEKGIFILNYQLDVIRHIEDADHDKSNLNDNPIYSLFKDHSDNIWVGTYFGGINLFIRNNRYLSIYPHDPNNFMSGKAIRQIIPLTQEELLIASEDGGLTSYNRSSGEFVPHSILNKEFGLKSKNVHTLLYDKDKILWIGTFGRGLYKYNYRTKKNDWLYVQGNKLRNYSCFDLAQDSLGAIWCATTAGLFSYNQYSGQLESHEWLKILQKSFIFRIIASQENLLWVATRQNGLYKVDLEAKQVDQIALDNTEFISALFIDSKKNIWVGTDGKGLYRLDENGENLDKIDRLLPACNSIKEIIEDNLGNIWFGTNNGLCCLNSAGNIKYFSIADGLPIQQFNYNSACKMLDGELFMGTIRGMISFYPDKIEDHKASFGVTLTQLLFNDNSYQNISGKNISELNEIELTYDQARSIRIAYSGLNFHFGKSTHYAIKLEGSTNEWQYVGKQSQVHFSNLPAGNYVLHIKAGNDDQTWDEEGMKSLRIKISPPWWSSHWAYGFYLFILSVIALIVYYYIRSRIELSMQLKTEHSHRIKIEELNQQKINFFTYLSHDLKTPLTLILSPLDRIIKDERTIPQNKERLSVIFRNAVRMQRLIDDLKTFSQIEMKQLKIRIRKGNILLFLRQTSHIFEMLAAERDIDFVINISESIDGEHWFSPSKLERIIYNLLSNAFKYTPAGGMVTLNVAIEATENGNVCVITVEDTGCGFPQDLAEKIFENYYQVNKNDRSIGTGVGLALTRMLVKLHHGTIWAQSQPEIGSKFTVRINISASDFEEDELSDEPIETDAIEKYNAHMRESVETLDMNQTKLVSKSDQRKRILIVEDNLEMNEYITQIMGENYVVSNAFNGNEGLKKAIIENPDLIISDVMMPETDGLKLVQILKSDITTAHIPVVLLTAKTEDDDITHGYKRGADAYITKPFNATNLELLVKNLMRTHSILVKNFHENENSQVCEIVTNPQDEKFMNKLVNFIMNNLDNSELNVTDITSELCISRSLLHNKIKAIANVSITEFVRSIRMKEAKKLLHKHLNISEVAFAVGISDPNYFTKCFKKQFGLTPSEYIRSNIEIKGKKELQS